MQDNKTVQGLYNKLKGEGYKVPEYDKFASGLQDDATAKKLYDRLGGSGYKLPSWEKFREGTRIAADETVPQAAVTEPVTHKDENVVQQNTPSEQPEVQQPEAPVDHVAEVKQETPSWMPKIGADYSKPSEAWKGRSDLPLTPNTPLATGTTVIPGADKDEVNLGGVGNYIKGLPTATRRPGGVEGELQDAEPQIFHNKETNETYVKDYLGNKYPLSDPNIVQTLSNNLKNSAEQIGQRESMKDAVAKVKSMRGTVRDRLNELRQKSDANWKKKVNWDSLSQDERNAALQYKHGYGNGYVDYDANLDGADVDEYRALLDVSSRLEEAENAYNRAQSKGDDGFFKKVWNNLSDYFSNPGTIDRLASFGWSNAIREQATDEIAQKFMKDTEAAFFNPNAKETLSEDEEKVLQARAYADQVGGYYNQRKHAGNVNFASHIGMESIPFMYEMYLTGGLFDGTIKGGLNSVASKVAPKIGLTAARGVATEAAVRSLLGNGLIASGVVSGSKFVGKELGNTLTGTLSGALQAGTMSLGTTIANTFERKHGNIQAGADGGIKIEGAKAFDDAFREGFIDSWIENASEKNVGVINSSWNALASGGKKMFASKAVGKFVEKHAGLQHLANTIANIGATQTFKTLHGFADAVQWHGPFKEYLEEKDGELARIALGIDPEQNNAKDFFNLEKNIDTLLGVSFMTGVMSVPAAIGYTGETVADYVHDYKHMKSLDKRGAQLFNAEWDDMRNSLQHAPEKELTESISSMIADVAVSDMEENDKLERIGFINSYAKEMMRKRGTNAAKIDAAINGDRAAAAEIDLEQSANEGYEATNDQKHSISNRYDVAKNSVCQLFGVDSSIDDEELVSWLTGQNSQTPAQFLSDMYEHTNEDGTHIYSFEQIQTVSEYFNAKAAYDGMLQGVRDGIDDKVETSNNLIDSNTNKADGMVHKGTDLDGQPIYIVSGYVSTFEDGTINKSISSGMIVIRDANGELKPVSADKIGSVDTELYNPAELKAEQEKAIREAEELKQADIIDGVASVDSYIPGNHVVLADGRMGVVSQVFPAEDEIEVALEDGSVDHFNHSQLSHYTPGETEGAAPQNDTAWVTPVVPSDENAQPAAEVAPAVEGAPATEDVVQPEGEVSPTPSAGTAVPTTDNTNDVPVDTRERDADGNLVYEKLSPEETLADMYQRPSYTMAEVSEFIDAHIKEAQTALDKALAEKPKAKITNVVKYSAEKEAIVAKQEAAQSNLDYWRSVQAQHAENINANASGQSEDEVIDYEPQNAAEYVASQLGTTVKITPESFRRETGYGTAEQSKMVGVIASEQNGGVSIERAAEILVADGELAQYGITDDSEVRNIIIDVLSQGNPRGYIKRAREAQKQELAEQKANELENFAQSLYHMSGSDYIAYEEMRVPELIVQYHGFDEDFFMSEINDLINERNEHRENDAAAESAENGGGSEVLSDEQPSDEEGTGGAEERNGEGESGAGYEMPGENGTEEEVEEGLPKPTKGKHLYRLQIETSSLEDYPEGGTLVDDGSQYGAIEYDNALSDYEVEAFELIPVSDAKGLVGKMYSRDAFSSAKTHEKMYFKVLSVDDDANVTFEQLLKGQSKERTMSYHDFKGIIRGCDELTDKSEYGKRPVEQKTEQPKQNKTKGQYLYRLRLRPHSIGTQPDGGKFVDDGSQFGAVVYDHKLTADEIETYSLMPITEAKELEGKVFEKPFIKGKKITFTVKSVDADGNISYEREYDGSVVTDTVDYFHFIEKLGDKAVEVSKSKGVSLPKETETNNEEAKEQQEKPKLLTEDEINALDIDASVKVGAIAYIHGNNSPAVVLAYKIVEDYVRNQPQVRAADSTDGNTSLMGSAPDVTAGGTSGQGGSARSGLDREGSEEDVSEVGSSGENSEDDVAPHAGERSDREVGGRKSDKSGVSSDSSRSKSSGKTRSGGRNVRKHGGLSGSGEVSANDGGRRDETQRGENHADDIISSALDEITDLLKHPLKLPKDRFYDATTLVAAFGVNAVKLFAATAKLGYGLVLKGYYGFKKWHDGMHKNLDGVLKSNTELSDEQIDELIGMMWDYPFEYNGETHTVAEWADKLKAEELRKIVGMSVEEKCKLQKEAEGTETIVGNIDNIRESLPFLLPAQQEDVEKAEVQFFDPSHADVEHGNGKGYMFTNGTGTGKTYTGLGIVKRFLKQGKGRVLIVTAQEKKINDWVRDAKNLGIEATMLPNTTTKGSGVVVTQYANIRQNYELLKDEFDLIVYDESHKIMENKDGDETTTAIFHHMLANRDIENAVLRELQHSSLWIREREINAELSHLDDLYKAASKPNPSRDVLAEVAKYGGLDSLKDKYDELRDSLTQLKERQEKVLEESVNNPEMRAKAEKAVARTKVVFLSATPFNTAANLDYVEGYIFSYPENGKDDRKKRKNSFLMEHFPSSHVRAAGGEVRRVGEASISDPEKSSDEEIAFSDHLQNDLHTMSGRMLDSPYDYSRQFPQIDVPEAMQFNQAVAALQNGEYAPLAKFFDHLLKNYAQQTALFEAIKTAGSIERIRKHIDMGRKVVVFHRRVNATTPLEPPFAKGLDDAEDYAKGENNIPMLQMIFKFKMQFKPLLEWEQSIDLSFPQEQITRAFATQEDKDRFQKELKDWQEKAEKARKEGKKVPNPPKLKAKAVGLFNGTETQTVRKEAVAKFTDDNSEQKVIVVQVQSGKEGIDLHDTTGVHQRTEIHMELPQSPIEFIQAEGRIYRVGNKSNAIFEYPLLGIDLELASFSMKINGRSQTAENLALGSSARGLRDSIARAALASKPIPVDNSQGIGGKRLDSRALQEATDYDTAIENFGTWANEPQPVELGEMQVPDPIGYKMIEWAMLDKGESLLVPYAGYGSSARYAKTSVRMIALESEMGKYAKLVTLVGGGGRKVEQTDFSDFSTYNKVDGVVIKPAHQEAVDIEKALTHLEPGGRCVAILSEDAADKIVEDVKSKTSGRAMVNMQVKMPASAFNGRRTRIVIFDRVDKAELREKAPAPVMEDLSDVTDRNELFAKMRDMKSPNRIIDQVGRIKKRVERAAKRLENNRHIRSITFGRKREKDLFVSDNGFRVGFKPKSLGCYIPGYEGRYRNFSIDFDKIVKDDFMYKEELAKCWVDFDETSKCSFEELKEKYWYANDKNADEMQELAQYLRDIISAAFNKTDSQIRNIAKGEMENKVSGKMTFDEFKEAFNGLNNNDAGLEALARRVFDVVDRIDGIQFSVVPTSKMSGHNVVAHYVPRRNIVELNGDYFNSLKYPDSFKASTIVHELIHVVTCYALDAYKSGRLDLLTDEQIQACKDIIDVYKSINNNEFIAELRLHSKMRDNAEYGLTNEEEMMAEMANPVFRAQLKLKKLWRQLVNGVKRLLGMDVTNEGGETNALDVLDHALEVLLENYNPDAYAEYTAGIYGRESAPEFNKTLNTPDGDLYRTSDELDEQYPTWLSGQTTGTGQHTTQIATTVNTYKKIGEWMKSEGFADAKVLDASSGLGKGTEALREMGFDVEDVEPYPSENRPAPTYSSYDDIDKKYDMVISNAVLNVIPDNWRRDVLHSMADKVSDGGMLIINVRDAKEIAEQKQKIELDSPSEILVTDKGGNIRAYQKGFTQAELTEWVQKELGPGWSVKRANKQNSGLNGRAVVAVKKDVVNREGNGPISDDRMSFENDPVAKMLGEPRGTRKSRANFAKRERERMIKQAKDLCNKLNLDNVEFVTSDELKGRKAKAKGFFNPKTGKITVVMDNQVSAMDMQETILHEAVAHYGLRKLFGKHFDTFLDNVYNSAEKEIKDKIDAFQKKHKCSLHEATEEYLAHLAESTEFENANTSWWFQIKRFFLDMLHKIGFEGFSGVTLTDNELRYLLWRSYENLARPGYMSSILGQAEDIDKQNTLNVGNFREESDSEKAAAWAWRNELVQAQKEHPGMNADELDNMVVSLYNKWGAADGVPGEAVRAKGRELFKNGSDNNGYEAAWKAAEGVAESSPTYYHTGEEDAIIAKAKADGTYMKAPNGKPTNLNERQWVQVRTENFKNWFGDWEHDPEHASKVVDENGEPKVVYHGSDSVFSVFDDHNRKWTDAPENTNWFAADKDFAESYKQDGSGQTLGLFLNIRNPYVINAEGRNWDDIPNEYDLYYDNGSTELEEFFDTRLEAENFAEEHNIPFDAITPVGSTTTNDKVSLAMKGGYDGVILKDVYDVGDVDNVDELPNHTTTDYVTFGPNAEKSATDNNGDFSTEDNDIYFRSSDDFSDDELNDAGDDLRRDYDATIKKTSFMTREAIQDSMLSLKVLMDKIAKFSGKTDVKDWENPYMAENALSSRNKAEQDRAKRLYYQPLINSLRDLYKNHKGDFESKEDFYGKICDYVMRKHALERQIEMSVRKALVDKDGKLDKEKYAEWKEACDEIVAVSWSDKMRQEAAIAQEQFAVDVFGKNSVEQQIFRAARDSMRDAEGNVDEDAYKEWKQRVKEFKTTPKADGTLPTREEVLQWEADSIGITLEGMEEKGRDFSGLTALSGEDVDGLEDAFMDVAENVEDFEERFGADEMNSLDDAIRNATHFSLQKMFNSGVISHDVLDDISSMYEHYVPLRGFDDTTAGEIYSYMEEDKYGSGFNSVTKKAEGRKSKADDPFAYILSMMDSAIMQGNKNLMKQQFLNFVQNRPNPLVTVSKMWIVRDPSTDTWTAKFPEIPENATPQEIDRIVKEFEDNMEKEVAEGNKDVKKVTPKNTIPYRLLYNQLSEHQIIVFRNGKQYVMTVNGDPRAAQAVNGKTNPNTSKNEYIRLTERVNRQLSSLYTTKNPDFVIDNFIRDMGFSNTMVWVKESPKYAMKFNANCVRFNPKKMFSLFRKYEDGKLNMSDRVEKAFAAFMENGGETGYSNLKDIEELKNQLGKDLKNTALHQASAIVDKLDNINRAVENSARFAAYMTSRAMGRSVQRSVWDAKEISVNFNKKGAGSTMYGKNGMDWKTIGGLAAGGAGTARTLYVFFNAGVQGLNNIGRSAKKHPGRFMALCSTLFTMGFAIAAAMDAFGGDDDDNYFNIPGFTRRSHLILGLPGSEYLELSLPIEYRTMYGLGEMAYSFINHKEQYFGADVPLEIARQFTQALPIDFLEGNGNPAFSLVPTGLAPLAQVIANESWTGMPIYKDTPFNTADPDFTKAYRSTSPLLKGVAKEWNELRGGNEHKKGWGGDYLDMNPAAIEHLLKGYFGGTYSFMNKVVKTGRAPFVDEPLEWREVPILNRIVTQADGRTQQKAIDKEFYHYSDALRSQTQYENSCKKEIRKARSQGDVLKQADWIDELHRLKSSKEYRNLKQFGRLKKRADRTREKLERVPSDVNLEQEWYLRKSAANEVMHD